MNEKISDLFENLDENNELRIIVEKIDEMYSKEGEDFITLDIAAKDVVHHLGICTVCGILTGVLDERFMYMPIIRKESNCVIVTKKEKNDKEYIEYVKIFKVHNPELSMLLTNEFKSLKLI